MLQWKKIWWKLRGRGVKEQLFSKGKPTHCTMCDLDGTIRMDFKKSALEYISVTECAIYCWWRGVSSGEMFRRVDYINVWNVASAHTGLSSGAGGVPINLYWQRCLQELFGGIGSEGMLRPVRNCVALIKGLKWEFSDLFIWCSACLQWLFLQWSLAIFWKFIGGLWDIWMTVVPWEIEWSAFPELVLVNSQTKSLIWKGKIDGSRPGLP